MLLLLLLCVWLMMKHIRSTLCLFECFLGGGGHENGLFCNWHWRRQQQQHSEEDGCIFVCALMERRQ